MSVFSILLRSTPAAFVFVMLAGCQTTTSPFGQNVTEDGLERVQVRGIDAVYRQPGASLAGYTKIQLAPVTVAFQKSWRPERDSHLYAMNPPDREAIRQELAKLFVDTVRDELRQGGYELVEEAGPDVLSVKASIVDLYISAPDVSMSTPAATRTYVMNAGEMTLVAELADSVTGAVLVRAYDKRRARETGSWQRATSIENVAEARRAIRAWASILKEHLDASRSS